jgi:response regulator RpfG family c-di-GMP phosphodiesterase
MDHKGQLLIADDEEIFLLSTADLLRREGYSVDCAKDAHEAARLLGECSYDVLISDIRMPGNLDLALLQRVPESNAGIPVILVTGYPSAPTAIRAINQSVLAYLVKPLDFEELLPRVREGVQLRKIQRAAINSSKRIQEWSAELGELAAGMGKSGVSGAVSVQLMVGVVLGRMGETLLDLKHLVDMSTPGKGVDICALQSCPRLELYERIIKEGIETLERTKGSFKSRELGDLRLKLEQTIEGKP